MKGSLLFEAKIRSENYKAFLLGFHSQKHVGVEARGLGGMMGRSESGREGLQPGREMVPPSCHCSRQEKVLHGIALDPP